MADRRQIEGMVQKKEQEIHELEEKIREAKIYIQALQDVLKKFPRELGSTKITGILTLRVGSMVELARRSVLKYGRPLHVDEILNDHGKELTRENRTALGGSLSAYVRKGEIFTRTGPNIFGLLELDHRHPADQQEPPSDFGTETETEAEADLETKEEQRRPPAVDLDDEIPF